MHRDSLGSVQEIEPGSVNWMTAGKGIVHSERTPEHLRKTIKKLHGLQIWVGLPKDQEQCEPSFSHIPAEQLPVWQDNDMNLKLIAGELFDKKTTVPVYSPLYLLELRTNSKGNYTISKSFYGERGIYILEGSIKIEEKTYHKGQILVLSEESDVEIEFLDASAIFVLGGERFAEERYIQWNYVSSELSLIERAIQDWYNRKYSEIPGEYEYNEMLKN